MPLPPFDPNATPVPSLPPGSLDLSRQGWQMVVQEVDPQSQELIGHWLAVGTLDSADPTWFDKLVEAPWQFDLYADKQPVVDGPVAGQVLYIWYSSPMAQSGLSIRREWTSRGCAWSSRGVGPPLALIGQRTTAELTSFQRPCGSPTVAGWP